MRGEAGNLTINLNIEDRRRIVLECASGLESPDVAELLFEEAETPSGRAVSPATPPPPPPPTPPPRHQILGLRGLPIAPMREEIDSPRTVPPNAWREVVARLGRHDTR